MSVNAQTFGGAGGDYIAAGAPGGSYGNAGGDGLTQGGTGSGGGGGGVGAPGGAGGSGGGVPGAGGGVGVDGGNGTGDDGSGGGGGGDTAQTTSNTSVTVSSDLTGGDAGSGGIGGSSLGAGTAAGGGGAGGFGLYTTGGGAAVVVNEGVAISAGAGGSGGATSTGGMVTAGGGGDGGYGVYFSAGGSLDNSGSISGAAGGAGGASVNAFEGYGGDGGAGGAGVAGSNLAITNGGSISGADGGAGGVAVSSGSGGADGANGAAGLGIIGSNLAITNSGSISAGLAGDGVTRGDAITFTGGDNTLTLDSGSSLLGDIGIIGTSTTTTFAQTHADAALSNVIAGTGNVLVDDGGSNHALTLTGTSTYTGSTAVARGTLVVEGSIGSSSQIVVASGGRLGGTGTVSHLALFGGSVLAPGNSIGTLIAASANFDAGMAFEVEVNGAGASDLLDVAGVTTIDGGKVVVLPFPDFATNTPYTIVTSAGGVNGTFNELEFDASSLFLSAALSYDANNVYLTINQSSFSSVAQTINQTAAARGADSLSAGNPVRDALLKLTTADQARQAYDALSGEVHASVAGVLIEDSRYVRDAIFGRLQQASYGNSANSVALASNGPATAGRMALGAMDKGRDRLPPTNALTFWGQAYGAWGTFDENGNAATVDRTLGGFVAGVDTNIGTGWSAGLATGYARSDLSVDARLSSGSIDSYQLAGYLGGRLGDFALRGGGAWTWSNIDTGRTVAFTGFVDHAGSSYHGDTGQLFGEVALPLIYAAAALEPFARFSYVNVDTDRFAERGGAAALSSSGASNSLGHSTLGVRIGTVTSIASALLTPHVSVAWQHAIGDVSPAQTLSFASGGTAFTVLGAPLARDSALIDAGLTLTLAPDATIGITYSGQLAADLDDNAVTGRFDWRF